MVESGVRRRTWSEASCGVRPHLTSLAAFENLMIDITCGAANRVAQSAGDPQRIFSCHWLSPQLRTSPVCCTPSCSIPCRRGSKGREPAPSQTRRSREKTEVSFVAQCTERFNDMHMSTVTFCTTTTSPPLLYSWWTSLSV